MLEVLKQLRVIFSQSGHNYQWLHEETGISKSTISRLMTGQTENPTLQNIIDIADALNCEIIIASVESKKAIDQQDIKYYRDAISDRDERIRKLEISVTKREEQIDEKSAAINRKDAYIKEKDKEIQRLTRKAEKNGRIILVLSLVACVLALLCVYFIADALNGHWGIFRY